MSDKPDPSIVIDLSGGGSDEHKEPDDEEVEMQQARSLIDSYEGMVRDYNKLADKGDLTEEEKDELKQRKVPIDQHRGSYEEAKKLLHSKAGPAASAKRAKSSDGFGETGHLKPLFHPSRAPFFHNTRTPFFQGFGKSSRTPLIRKSARDEISILEKGRHIADNQPDKHQLEGAINSVMSLSN